MNYWWVVASDRDQDNGWHWSNFFETSDEDIGDDWGGSDWIKSSYSHKRIREMNEGDVVVAYQAGEGVVGFTYLASGGKISEYEDVYDCFDLSSIHKVYLTNLIPLSIIRALPDSSEHFEFVNFQQSTVFRMTPDGFNMLLKVVFEENQKQERELEKFLLKGGLRKPHTVSAGAPMTTSVLEPPKRMRVEAIRVVRDSAKSRKLKKKYGYSCQLCGCRIEVTTGKYYAEVHHIRPLGGDHRGLDDTANMIVVCPNHHAYFDLGVPRFLSKNEVVIGAKSFKLTVKHEFGEDNVEYHNRIIFGCNI